MCPGGWGHVGQLCQQARVPRWPQWAGEAAAICASSPSGLGLAGGVCRRGGPSPEAGFPDVMQHLY